MKFAEHLRGTPMESTEEACGFGIKAAFYLTQLFLNRGFEVFRKYCSNFTRNGLNSDNWFFTACCNRVFLLTYTKADSLQVMLQVTVEQHCKFERIVNHLESFASFFARHSLKQHPALRKRRPVGNLNPSCLLRSAFSWGLLASWLVPRWSSRAIFLIKKHGSHDMGQNSSPTKMDGWILKISENDTNQPQINHKSTHTGVWLIEKNMTCGSSNRFSPVKDGDGHHTSSLRSTQTDRTGGRTSCDEVDLGWPFLSHSDSYQSTLWIVPLCHQVRGKTMSWFGSLAKTRLARLDVCRSLFSMLCITCSGEQIQPVEKVWRGMFWRLDPFYCALTWNVIQF